MERANGNVPRSRSRRPTAHAVCFGQTRTRSRNFLAPSEAVFSSLFLSLSLSLIKSRYVELSISTTNGHSAYVRARARLCKLKRLHGFTYFNRFRVCGGSGARRARTTRMRKRRKRTREEVEEERRREAKREKERDTHTMEGSGGHSKSAGEAFCRVFYGKL